MQNYIEHIEINPKIMLGKPVVKGTPTLNVARDVCGFCQLYVSKLKKHF